MLCAVWRRCKCECVERARDRPEPHLGQMQVAAGGFQIRVTEQKLNSPQVRAGLKQMCGETVPQGMWVHPFPDSGAGGGVFDGVEHKLRQTIILCRLPNLMNFFHGEIYFALRIIGQMRFHQS